MSNLTSLEAIPQDLINLNLTGMAASDSSSEL